MAATAQLDNTSQHLHAITGPDETPNHDCRKKYALEREKRLREDGMAQYIDPSKSGLLKKLLNDPWTDEATPVSLPVANGGHCRFAIIGAGFGGITYAVKLIQAGFKAEDMIIIDPAGGFGGTWYWNRYPGVMCDIESYIYMPMLEEMGHVPSQKYVSGEELRQHAESIATKYGLCSRAMFRCAGRKMTWDSDQWNIEIEVRPGDEEESTIQINARFVLFASGLFNGAKIPNIRGCHEFKGNMFHAARWAYDVTGGSFADQQLTNLQSKVVGIVGTGATAVQAIPVLAKWSKALLVFQRTPSAVDVRENHDTDSETWETKIATTPGWQRRRIENFNAFMSNVEPKPKVNMVGDGWTHIPAYSVLLGGPRIVTADTLRYYADQLHRWDFPRQEGLRNRVVRVVQDPAAARGLQAWYPSWCKRPCFHDEYLEVFNKPNVTLVATDGKGIDHITPTGVVASGNEYKVDVLIWATGYAPAASTAAAKANIAVFGRGGQCLDDVAANGLNTLHGVISQGFPNMFWGSLSQGAAAPNYTYLLDVMATHTAHIISRACEMAGPDSIIEPTAECQESWARRVKANALPFAALAGCTPSYFNNEGMADQTTEEEKEITARSRVWGRGIKDFTNILEEWRAGGMLEGLEVTTIRPKTQRGPVNETSSHAI